MNKVYFVYDGFRFNVNLMREDFIKLIELNKYKWYSEGDKIIINHYTNVYLPNVQSLPENVIFKNGADVYLNNLESISDGIQFINRNVNIPNIGVHQFREGVFMNYGSVYTNSFSNINWDCDIPYVRKGTVLNLMIKRGIIK